MDYRRRYVRYQLHANDLGFLITFLKKIEVMEQMKVDLEELKREFFELRLENEKKISEIRESNAISLAKSEKLLNRVLIIGAGVYVVFKIGIELIAH